MLSRHAFTAALRHPSQQAFTAAHDHRSQQAFRPARLLDPLLSILLAPRCLACHAILDCPTEGPVCPVCWRAVVPLAPPLCESCGDVLPSWRAADALAGRCARCRRHPPLVARARAAGAYDGVLRELVHALKYEGRRTLAPRLAALMRDRGAEVLAGADVAVPVPLHWRRQYARGFNQAEELARGLGLPVVSAVRRVRATSAQFGLGAAGRRHNVRAAFAAPCRGLRWDRGPRPRRRHDSRLDGACVVLVDDVNTTGATLEACAVVLREGGAREVRALTAARALTARP